MQVLRHADLPHLEAEELLAVDREGGCSVLWYLLNKVGEVLALDQ